MNNQRVWMTGASGFVGGHILRQLLDSGREVACLVRNLNKLSVQSGPSDPGGSDPGSGEPGRRRPRLIAGDLSDASVLDDAAAGADACIHLVGIIAERGRQTFQRVHIDGTRAVIEACRRAGVGRLLHMSALGATPDGPSEYYRTKAHAEQLVRESGLAWTIFRPSIIHGPDGEFTQMLARFATGLMPMPTLGPGIAKATPIWIEDVARCFVGSLDRNETIGRSFDLGGPTVLTWNQMYDTVSRVVRGRTRAKLHIPVAAAKTLAAVFWAVPGVRGPFNRDQVVMAQCDIVADAELIERTFGFRPADFEPTLAEYRGELLAAIDRHP